jgi:hypothetical protein
MDSKLAPASLMNRYPFIFSNEFRYRFQRHFLFWVSWWLFQSVLYSFSAGLLGYAYFKRLPVASLEAFMYLAPHMFLAYSLMYFVTPQLLLKGKYIATVVTVLLLFIATGAIASSIGVYVLDYFRRLFLGRGYVPPPHVNELYFFLGLLAGLRGAITIGGLAAAIKLMKYWYMKEQRNLQLQKENIAAQLQLLKAQVHPHFLFNTLNNIYAHTQVSSPIASGMIIKLSELLRYMLYECNQSLVPLTKEFNMLRDYISLEQIRYGNKPDLNIDLPETSDELYIAPLLLLPFIENSFKHGASHMLEQPWISLQISINDLELKMKLLNGKNPHSSDAHGGIGIDNVKKRLELLYPQQHQLSINNEEEVFIVNLSVQLEQRKTSETALTSKNKMIHA